MANNKTGFLYYNVDTDRYQDIRIKRLKKSFGCNGIAVYDYILCEIYRDKGCFLVWDESRAFDVAEYFVIKESLVNEIVRYCGAVGLFDKELLTCGTITSLSIQKRYAEMCKRAKRLSVEIPEECRIIQEECRIIPEHSVSLPQSKVKESKVKESRLKPPLPPFGESSSKTNGQKIGTSNVCDEDEDEDWIFKIPDFLRKSLKTFCASKAQSGKAIHSIQLRTMVAKLLHATKNDFYQADEWVQAATAKGWGYFFDPNQSKFSEEKLSFSSTNSIPHSTGKINFSPQELEDFDSLIDAWRGSPGRCVPIGETIPSSIRELYHERWSEGGDEEITECWERLMKNKFWTKENPISIYQFLRKDIFDKMITGFYDIERKKF